jgi:hypothetical protein
MVWHEASSRRKLAEADEIDKNSKLYSMPTDELERLYLCGGAFKPLEQFQSCAKCDHNLVDKFLLGNGDAFMDKKGNPTTKVPNPKFLDEPLLCHCWQQFMSTVLGGYICILGCVHQITGKQDNEGKCPVSL